MFSGMDAGKNNHYSGLTRQGRPWPFWRARLQNQQIHLSQPPLPSQHPQATLPPRAPPSWPSLAGLRGLDFYFVVLYSDLLKRLELVGSLALSGYITFYYGFTPFPLKLKQLEPPHFNFLALSPARTNYACKLMQHPV